MGKITLTGMFQQTLQWRLYSGQNISTHLFKLTPGVREKVEITSTLWANFKIKDKIRPCRKMKIILRKKNSMSEILLADLFSFAETSMSFMKHSMFRGRSEELALINFFSFSHSW